MNRFGLVVPVIVTLAAACAPNEEPPVAAGKSRSALTAEQCDYFAVDGKITICHKTESTKHPYTILRVSQAACADAHADHPDDHVSLNDTTCNGGGCLPEAAPCDATVPCCEGLTCQEGKCAKVAPPRDPCDGCGSSICWVPQPADGSNPCALSSNSQCQVGDWVKDWCDTGAACIGGIVLWCSDPGVQWHFPR